MTIHLRQELVNPLKLPRKFTNQLSRAWQFFCQNQNVEIEITILLTSAVRVRELNNLYRGLNKTTDVLSFPYRQGEELIAGDIIIDVARANKQAKQRSITVEQEITRLSIHGMAHIVGFLHDSIEEFAEMRSAECDSFIFSVSKH